MPSPFPGMDPFLEHEQLWLSFQHGVIACVHDILVAGLRDEYECRVGERRYAVEEASSDSRIRGEQREQYIEIRRRDNGRLVTLFDVVSPANKTTSSGREAYLNTRRQSKAAGASLVEVDLVLQGKPMLDYSRDGLPQWDYAVTVTRSTMPDRFEIYTATLQKRLPRFRLPMGADERDIVLDLSTVFSQCYERAGFEGRVDYQREPGVPLGADSRRWIDELLQATKLRGQLAPHVERVSREYAGAPSNERVAVAAYFLWQQEGCPHGRDKEHWESAEEQLRRQAGVG